jgi:hypothetical protein
VCRLLPNSSCPHCCLPYRAINCSAVTHLLMRLGSAALSDPRVGALLFPLLQHATNLGARGCMQQPDCARYVAPNCCLLQPSLISPALQALNYAAPGSAHFLPLRPPPVQAAPMRSP